MNPESLSQCGHSSALTALRILTNYNQQLLLPPDISALASFGGISPTTSQLPTRYLSYCGQQPVLSPTQCYLDPVQTSLDVRRRSEKRPIPDEQKDEKYFERRKRNNQAAKKSRDARKIREDQIALRACVLEHENATLRAHLAALCAETAALRELLAAATSTSGAHYHATTNLPSSTTAD